MKEFLNSAIDNEPERRYVAIVDDNMHYQSMRSQFYKLARNGKEVVGC